ncbi:MAG: DNA repair exonuclease [Candidatus Woesearchaeota archaeon]
MRFAHMADIHIGSWREPKLTEANLQAFIRAIDICMEKKVDFILISGDLFNTSLPAIDKLKVVVKVLKQIKESDIEVYVVPGSHDFSPSGKTMLDVLENAGLIKNVVKGNVKDGRLFLDFTIDTKTGAKITGMLGKKGMLEKTYYESLAREHLEKCNQKENSTKEKTSFKIFMFHTALTELKPVEMAEMDSAPISLLPKGFDYYAGGHVHIVEQKKIEGYGNVIYPGPLFPNNIKEIEELKHGGFYIYDDGNISYHQIPLYNIVSISIDCNHRLPLEVRTLLLKKIDENSDGIDLSKTIITIRLYGVLSEGNVNDIAINEIFEQLYDKGAYFIMKNLNKLTTKEFEEIKLSLEKSHDVEDSLINEHIGKIGNDINNFVSAIGNDNTGSAKDEKDFVKMMMNALDIEKQEGEKIFDFEKRIKENFESFFKI